MLTTNRLSAAAPRTSHAPKAADYLTAQLKPLNDVVTLKMFGEDDNGSATVAMRHGPVSALTRESVTKALGYKIETSADMTERVFEFKTVKRDDAEFWDTFQDTQEDPAAGVKARALFTGKNVVEVAALVIDEPNNRRPFAATAFLVARMNDGSIAYLRGTVGGMCY